MPEARRVALAAQGLGAPRPRRPDIRHVRKVIRRLHLLQIDFVNVLLPAHYQVPFSRLGPYDRDKLDELVYERREFTEQWAHEASIIPVGDWAAIRAVQGEDRRARALATFARQEPAYVARVMEEIRARGPLGVDDFDDPQTGPRGDWHWPVPKRALEALLVAGELAVTHRKDNMARVFDLAPRALGDAVEEPVARDAALRRLMRNAARAQGIGTAADLADYYRLPVASVRPALDALEADGGLRRVAVASWREPAWMHPAATAPRRVNARALLSPFDPVVWTRPRVARLFGFDYKVELFVPAAKRRWGYYVLPFLYGDRLVARVDLKARRKDQRLDARAAYIEDGVARTPVARALAAELETLAAWLGLGGVRVERRGNFARTLRRALR